MTINGSNFGSSPTVKFNGTAATSPTVNGAGTQITATVPAGATTGKITVEVAGQTTATSATDFTVTVAGAPAVSLSPTGVSGLTNFVGYASASTNYTVTGTNLGGTNLVVTASTNAIEVSTNASTGFTNTLTLASAGDGTLTNTLWVRVSAVAPSGAVNASVTHVSGTASNTLTVAGTVTTPALTLSLSPTAVSENAGAAASTGTVGIPFALTNDLTINLASSNTAAATVPASVVITNGQTNATFAIAAVANTNSFANQTAVISASATNYTTANATLTVNNVDVPPAVLAAKGWINEFHYDNAGTDSGEFVEIVLAASTPTNNVVVVLYNGGNGAAYATNALATFTNGVTTNGFTVYSVGTTGIQNGAPDGIALIINGVPEDLVSYEGSFVATDGPAAGYTLPDIGISEAGTEAVGGSLYRYGPGTTGADFAWAKAAVATLGQPNSGQELGATGVQGTGTIALANSTATSALLGKNIFEKNSTNQTVSLTLTGTLTSGSISAMSVTVPSQFSGLTSTNQITITGTGGAAALVGLTGQTVTVTGLAVDRVNTAVLNIAGLTTPETAGSLANDGNYSFAVQTGTVGNLKSVLLPTTALVVIPIANLGDVDASGVSLDAGKTVAVQGVCTEENFNSSSSTSAYLQNGQPDGTNKAGINVYSTLRNLFVRSNNYVVLGSVLNYSGLTEVVITDASNVLNLGLASNQPTPVTLTIGQLTNAHEAYEGSLVRVVGLSKQTNGGTWAYTTTTNNTNGTVTTSGGNIILQNGGTNLTTRLNVGSTATTEPIYPAGITGIYGQFVAAAPFIGGGQIQPRDQADIEDAPGLKLTLADSLINEGGSFTSTTLTILRTGDTTAALQGTLSGVPSDKVRVSEGGVPLNLPHSFTIPSGQASVDLTIEAIDNAVYSGDSLVALTAIDTTGQLVSGTTTLTVLENDALPAPTGLSYTPSSVSSKVNVTITNMVPSVTGVVSGYSISPTLPAGLAINTTNGLISGTPTAISSNSYTVTATNASGSTTASVTIAITAVGSTFDGAYPGRAITEVAPNGLTYLVNYAFGGTSSNAAVLPTQDNSDPTKLTLIAVVRTDDSTLTVAGEASTGLTNGWSTSGVAMTNSTNQTSLPANTARKVVSVDRGTDPKKFLRIKVTK